MKRYWAVILTAATLASCRSNQPATNPFMRTTVPPPATTTGVIVTPGQPMAQGISPPLVTQPAPVITSPPPITTQPVPVTPAPPPVAAPMAAPPSVAPQGDQFRYPGGSYIFHQSSNDPPPAAPGASEVKLASATLPAGEPAEPSTAIQATYVEPSRVYISSSMSQAPIIENPYVAAKNAQPQAVAAAKPQLLSHEPAAKPLAASQAKSSKPQGSLTQSKPAVQTEASAKQVATAQSVTPKRISLGTSRGDPPDTAAFVRTSSGSSTLRIVGASSPPSASSLVAANPATQMAIAPPTPRSKSTGSVLRITAGGSTPALRSTVETTAATSNVAIKTTPADSTTARIVSPPGGEKNVIQTSFEPAGSSSPISNSPENR